MLDWPFQANSALSVQGWGFWLAILGMVVSIVGFGITIVQLTRTKRATSAVSEEIRRIKFAVSKYDATVEASRAESSLQSARRYVKVGDWSEAGGALEALAKSFHTLRELNIPELTSHLTEMESVMAYISKLCERLDRSGINGLPDTEKSKTLASMREHDRLITSLRISLQRSSIGE